MKSRSSSGTILVASPRGFCAGVSYAIEIVNLVLERYGAPVYVRHEIVHNRHVVEDLRAKGARFVDDLAEVPTGAVVIFSAHGVSPAIRDEARQRELRAIDATCPLVTKVHLQVLKYAREGFEILLIGHRGHVEVEGTMGHAPDLTQLVENVIAAEKVQVRNPARLAIVTQTTLSVDDTRDVIEVLVRRFPQVRTPQTDDICYATQNRQSAVKDLAQRSDVVFVLGSPTSSNASRLVEVAHNHGAAAHLIEEGRAIDPSWLEDVDTVGLTAGASTPEPIVQGAIEHLQSLGFANVQTFDVMEESVSFPLPRELRN